ERGAAHGVQEEQPIETLAGGHAKADESRDDHEQAQAGLRQQHEVAHHAGRRLLLRKFQGHGDIVRDTIHAVSSMRCWGEARFSEIEEESAPPYERTASRTVVAKTAAPLTTCSVVKIGGRKFQMTNMPSNSCPTKSVSSSSAGRVSLPWPAPTRSVRATSHSTVAVTIK